MIISVPHLSFEINGRILWIDGHFPVYLENKVRVAALVRPSVDNMPAGRVLKLEVNAEDLHHMVIDILGEAKDEVKKLGCMRSAKMGRWNLSRILFLVTGYFKRISEDEKMIAKERELRTAIEILEKVARAQPQGNVGYLNVKIDSDVDDEIYRRLAKIDEGFKKRLQKVIQ